MSDNNQVPSGEPAAQPSGQSAGDTNHGQSPSGAEPSKTVQYDTYAKTLAQEKALRERLKAAEEKLAETERKKLEAEGKKDELIEHYKKENEEIKAKSKQAEAEKANEKISSQVMKKAMEMGCVDADMAKDLVSFSDLDVNESYKVGDDSLTLALDRLKRSKPYLFQGKKAAVVDAPPASPQMAGVTQPTSVSDMSVEQMEALYRKKFGGATQ